MERCFYNPHHIVSSNRLILHYIKFHANEKEVPTCPFNITHRFHTEKELKDHMPVCSELPNDPRVQRDLLLSLTDLNISTTKITPKVSKQVEPLIPIRSISASYLSSRPSTATTMNGSWASSAKSAKSVSFEKDPTTYNLKIKNRNGESTRIHIDGVDDSSLRDAIMRSSHQEELLPMLNKIMACLYYEHRRNMFSGRKVTNQEHGGQSSAVNARSEDSEVSSLANSGEMKNEASAIQSGINLQSVKDHSDLNSSDKSKEAKVDENLSNTDSETESIYSKFDENDEKKNKELLEHAKQLKQSMFPWSTFPSFDHYQKIKLDDDGMSVKSESDRETIVGSEISFVTALEEG